MNLIFFSEHKIPAQAIQLTKHGGHSIFPPFLLIRNACIKYYKWDASVQCEEAIWQLTMQAAYHWSPFWQVESVIVNVDHVRQHLNACHLLQKQPINARFTFGKVFFFFSLSFLSAPSKWERNLKFSRVSFFAW